MSTARRRVRLQYFSNPGLPVTGNRVARHYLGFAEHDVRARVTQHLRRQGIRRWSRRCSPPAVA